MQIGYELLNQEYFYGNQQEIKMVAIKKLKTAGCQNIYIDVGEERTQFKKAIESSKNGDILVVPQFNSLGISRYSFLKNLGELKSKGIHLYCLESNHLLSPHSSFIDDTKMILSFFPSENELKIFQTKQAKAKKKGRPKVLSPERRKLIKLLQIMYEDFTITGSCKLACISRPIYYQNFKTKQELELAS